MFAGLDDIAWGAMNHAYGPASQVPDLLRALVSDDPAARESALDAMYGAVHHQGDVYECTVALIPFLLEIVGEPTLPGRGAVLELLTSIGGAADDEAEIEDGDADEEDGEDDGVMFFGPARDAIAAACPLFMDLLADADPEVRRAAPAALLVCRSGAQPAVSALQDRLRGETDPSVRAAIVSAVGTFGARAAAGRVTDVDAAAIGAWFAELAAGTGDPAFRLVCVAALARCAPAALRPDVVSTAVELLRTVYEAGTPPTRPAGFSTDTLIGTLRQMSEREAAGRRSPDAAGLVSGLSVALGDRVEDRVGLLTRLLRAPQWEARYDAIRPATVLMEGWRGQYEELVFLIGEQLTDPRPLLSGLAADAFKHLDELAAPAADALARSLDAAPREAPPTRGVGLPAWITVYPDQPPRTGPTLCALAALRDTRALPAVRWAMEHPDLPEDIGGIAGRFGPAAADLVPLIRRRLRDLPTVDGRDWRRGSLVGALGQIGVASAAAVPELLALPPEPRLLETIVRTLGRIGPGAADAIPAMRRLLSCGEPGIEIAAASALWRVDGDPGPVLPVLTRHLDGDTFDASTAAQALAEFGATAASAAPMLRKLSHGTETGYGTWSRLYAAQALWRATGDADAALPVLSAIWSENPATRVEVARCIAEMGPAAETAAPLLREELGRRRRHTARDGGWYSGQVEDDQALLHACHAALASVDP